MDALEASAQSSSEGAWDTLVGVVRAEYAEAVENTVDCTRALISYRDVDDDAIREAIRSNFDAVLNGLEQRRHPDARDDGAIFEAARETRARPGLDLAEMLSPRRPGLPPLPQPTRPGGAAV